MCEHQLMEAERDQPERRLCRFPSQTECRQESRYPTLQVERPLRQDGLWNLGRNSNAIRQC